MDEDEINRLSGDIRDEKAADDVAVDRPVGGWLRNVVFLGRAFVLFYLVLSVYAIVVTIYAYFTE